MAVFVDYYHVLQVHHDASQEVVDAAYRRLCKIYHPDVNPRPQALERMKQINEAYEIVGRTDRRREYHNQWLHRQRPSAPPRSEATAQQAPKQEPPRQEAPKKEPPRRESPRQEAPKKEPPRQAPPKEEPRAETPPKPPVDEALTALDDFFHALIEQDWDRAYGRLATADRRNVLLSDFREWKRTVAQLFTMGSYAIKPFRRYENCRIDGVMYPQVREYSVFITDIDLRTGRVNEESVLKHVALDGGQWRVVLGYQDVRSITLRYKYLLDNMSHIDPAQVYADAVTRQDSDTGLMSRRAFLERAEQEAIRSRRYGNPFSIGILRVTPSAVEQTFDDETYGRMCVTHAAHNAVGSLRQTDVVGRWGAQEIVILFTETPKAKANHAVVKVMGRLYLSGELNYEVSWGLADFDGVSVEDAILSAASDARARTTTRDGVTATTITVE